MKNKEFLVAGIKNLLETNYKISSDLYDIESEVDSTLSFEENWNNFKNKFNIQSEQEKAIKIKSFIEMIKRKEQLTL